jgi:hypothetical protein
MTKELRGRMLLEGLTAAIIGQTHADAVTLYKTEKTSKLEKMEEIGDVLRSETKKARHLSVEKYSRHHSNAHSNTHSNTRQVTESPPPLGNRNKLVSVDLTDDGDGDDNDLSYSYSSSRLQLDLEGGGRSCRGGGSHSNSHSHSNGSSNSSVSDVELPSSLAELEFVSDYKTSVLDAKKAFAKNWVVMQAAEYELKAISQDCLAAKEEVDVIESRDTFIRLTIADQNTTAPCSDSLNLTGAPSLEETEVQLILLGDELKKVSSVESFYRELRKRPKAEFNDAVLISDIVSNIDILIKEITKQKKEIEKQMRHFKGVRLKTKLLNRPIPRLIMGAVRRKSDAGSSRPNSGTNSSNNTSSQEK